ncbi:MAG: carbohydrate-binding protein [Dysgonamonadaceae bacterium]|jgi:hypothetical protein|nr:carbohydrate-binding protein [Dysgonamonadaceae bacterium]
MKAKTITINRVQLRKQLFLLSILLFGFALLTQAQTRSYKRGIGYNRMSRADVEALSFGLSWTYNWGFTGSGIDAVFSEFDVEFIPMAWSDINKTTARNYLRNHPETKYVLGFNEPNFNDQANISPATAAARWKAVEEIADEFGLITVGPALNYSPNPPYQDPLKWYDEFFQLCTGCRVDHIAIHLYMPAGDAIKSNVERFKKYGRPIWLTEFCAWEDGTNAESQKRFLVEALDYLETDPDIYRYAWFKDRWDKPHPYNHLLAAGSGVRTELGDVFTYMSSYDDDFYFTTNQQIPAEHYIRMKGLQLEKTTDESDNLNLTDFDPTSVGDYVDYNIDVPAAGEYDLDFRIAFQYGDVSEIIVSVDGVQKGSMVFANKGIGVWNTQQCKATLAAGKQKIRLSFKRGGCKINWWSVNGAGTGITAPQANPVVSVFPNPVSDKLYLRHGETATLTVFDLSGARLYEVTNASSVDLSALPAGVYLVAVQPQGGEKSVHKIVKQ